MLIDRDINGLSLRFVLNHGEVRVYYKEYLIDSFKSKDEDEFKVKVNDYVFLQ